MPKTTSAPTPHNSAKPGEIAKTVLMPGDPLRSKWIADTFLEDAKLINNIRGVQGYTGTWEGNPVTVMASGMGIPSISIYAYELYNFYDVDRIIRVGTAGSVQPDLNIGDVVIADKAYTNSVFLKQLNMAEGHVPRASRSLLASATLAAKELKAAGSLKGDVRVGPVLTEEIYYSEEEGLIKKWADEGVLAFEMEAAALYAHAEKAWKRALAVFTVSNNILIGNEMDPKDRERSLGDMVKIALRAAFSLPAADVMGTDFWGKDIFGNDYFEMAEKWFDLFKK